MPSSISLLARTSLFYALRLVFRLTPLSQVKRDRLRQQFLNKYSGLVPAGPRGKLGHFSQFRRPLVRADERAIGYVPRLKAELPDPLPATLVAFYLPQFHTIPENDEWWGKGFTEWRNVARALPQFEGHVQPRTPGDLGFYDLHNPKIMREQATLAREYGIGAFCFYAYWFDGKTLLETPLRNWLNDKSIDLSFCVCWANEKWSRRWDGRGDDILIDQQHSAEDDLAFIEYIADYLRDPRYLRVAGKPILILYRPGLLPDCAATSERWRRWCRDNGVGDIHLAYVQSFERPDPALIGFDSAIEFPPNLASPTNVTQSQRLINPDYLGQVLDWRQLAREYEHRQTPAHAVHPGVSTGWDNEPRRSGNGRVYAYSSPRRYRDWLKHTINHRLGEKNADERLVFINAWNEWAEGAVLEPDSILGHAWLERTRQAMQSSAGMIEPAEAVGKRPCVVIHAWYADAFDEILTALQDTKLDWRILVTTSPDRLQMMREVLAARGSNAEVLVFENRGRDILPFIQAAEFLIEEGVDFVLKLHTKRSPHLQDGDAWRRDLVSNLLDIESVSTSLSLFSEHDDIGMVVAAKHLLPVRDHMGGNSESMQYLERRSGLFILANEALFPSGSMYWVRLEALRPLLDAHLRPSEFEAEVGQTDGTLAHAVERFAATCVQNSGFRLLTTSSSSKTLSASRVPNPYAAPADAGRHGD